MKREILSGILGIVLAFCALPALAAAAEDSTEALRAAIFAPAPEEAPVPEAPGSTEEPFTLPGLTPAPQTRAMRCPMTCWNGSFIECVGTTCYTIKSNCAQGEEGVCVYTNGSISCPPCPTPCTVRATCNPTGSVSCTSYNAKCSKLDKCFVQCDGRQYWCARPASTCPI